jgi:putative endonuclease
MGNPRHRLGRDAERAVARWLAGRGWTILAERWRAPVGELDLVAVDPGGALVAVEVKARATGRSGSPLESVDRRRVARLRAALRACRPTLAPGPEIRELRVDLAAVSLGGAGWEIRLEPGIDAW